MERLVATFNPATVAGLMCRNTISVGWDGTLHDCDFNQMLDLAVEAPPGRRAPRARPRSRPGSRRAGSGPRATVSAARPAPEARAAARPRDRGATAAAGRHPQPHPRPERPPRRLAQPRAGGTLQPRGGRRGNRGARRRRRRRGAGRASRARRAAPHGRRLPRHGLRAIEGGAALGARRRGAPRRGGARREGPRRDRRGLRRRHGADAPDPRGDQSRTTRRGASAKSSAWTSFSAMPRSRDRTP